MTTEGPTTVGSIDAKLTLDASEFDRKAEEAKVTARDLGAMSPNVKVDADVAGALVSLGEVKVAEDSVSQSADSMGQSSGAAAINMGTLWSAVAALAPAAIPISAMALGLTGSLTGMGAAAVLAFKGASAEMGLGTDLGMKYTAAVNDLQGAFQVLEDTAASGLIVPFTAAVKSVTDGLPQLTGEIGILAGQLGGIVSTGIDAVVNGLHIMEPLFINAGNYVEHLVGAFAGFTNQGGLQQFADYALSTLPSVSALLDSLLQTVWHLLDALAPIGTIGVAALTDISNVINAIPTPALTAIIAAATGGFLAFKMWGLLAPVIMGVGTAVSFVKDRMVGMTAAAAESAAAETVLAETTAVAGGVMEAAMGPIGWIIAGVGALAAGFMAASASSDQASASVNSYTSALQQDNGVIGEHTKQQAAAALSTQDNADAAAALGLTTQQLTEAATGNVHMQKLVNEKLDEAQNKYKDAGVSVDDYGRATQILTPEQQKLKDAHDKVSGAVKTQTDAVNAGVAATEREAAATGQTVQEIKNHADALSNISLAYNTANASQTEYLKALETYGKSAGTAADKGAFIGATLKASQGDALGYAGALAGASKANATLTETFEKEAASVAKGQTAFSETEKAAIDLKTGLIDVNAAGAGPLISNLESMQSAAVNAASAMYQHEAASKGAGQAAQDAATIFKTDTYDALIKDAGALGLTQDQASKLADQYFQMPKDISTQVMTIGEQKVVTTLDQIGQQLAVLTHTPWKSVLTADNQTGPGAAAAAATIAAATAPPAPVRIDANTDSIKPKIVGMQDMIDGAVNHQNQIKLDIQTADAKAKVDYMQATIDGLQQKKEALLKVGTTDALQQASNLQAKIDDIKQQKAVALMVNPDPAIASTTSIQDHIDELKQKNQPQIKADPIPAWQMIQKTQDSIDVLHQKHDIPIMVDTHEALTAVANFQGEIDALHGRTIQVTTNYVSNGQDTGVPNTTNVPNGGGNARFNASGGLFGHGAALKRAGGGILNAFPGGVIQGPGSTTSDDVPLWGSRDEYVVKASSVASVTVPVMDYINRTGQLPQQQTAQTPNITVYVTNPFTGEQVQAVVQSVANAAISGANRDARYRRVGV
jgi:hypothetical protein